MGTNPTKVTNQTKNRTSFHSKILKHFDNGLTKVTARTKGREAILKKSVVISLNESHFDSSHTK